ncbi:MAG: hypothetical protein D6814_03040 [Calditrichaeota bacterium]|nr:MAG: hypothetical protein D6814_03040 [Calditrichota bacterium]
MQPWKIKKPAAKIRQRARFFSQANALNAKADNMNLPAAATSATTIPSTIRTEHIFIGHRQIQRSFLIIYKAKK